MQLQAVIGFCLCAAALSVLLKQYLPEYSLVLSIACGVGVLVWLVGELAPILEQISRLSGFAFSDSDGTGVLIKSLGICLITQIACDTCRDIGEGAIASRLEIAGKAAMLLLALPMFVQLLELALGLIG